MPNWQPGSLPIIGPSASTVSAWREDNDALVWSGLSREAFDAINITLGGVTNAVQYTMFASAVFGHVLRGLYALLRSFWAFAVWSEILRILSLRARGVKLRT